MLGVIAGTGATTSAAEPPKVEDVAGLTNLAGPFGVDVQRDGTITVALQGAPPDPESGFPGEPGRIIKAKKGNVTTLKSFDGAGPSDVATGALRSHLLDRR